MTGTFFASFCYLFLAMSVDASHVPNSTVCSTTLDDSLWNTMNANGNCEPYLGTATNRVSVCDTLFTVGATLVYIPNSREHGDQSELRLIVEEISAVVSILPSRCSDPFVKVICTHFYFPCGGNATYSVPRFLCPNVCTHVTEILCPQEWDNLLETLYTQVQPELRDDPPLQLPANCSTTNELLDFLSLTDDCCTDAGISTKLSSIGIQLSSTSEHAVKQTSTYISDHQTMPSNTVAATSNKSSLIVIITPSVIVLWIIISVIVGMLFGFLYIMKKKKSSFINENDKAAAVTFITAKPGEIQNDYSENNDICNTKIFETSYTKQQHPKIPAVYLRHFSSCMIHSSDIHLLDLIGHGEFGMVYRATLTTDKDYMPKVVAVKTLKRRFSGNDLEAFIEEMMKMHRFNHLNVLSLIGVCLDLNEAPCIVMPFMSEGSLLSYLKRERSQLSIAENAAVDEEFVNNVTKQLLSMCLQVANGMEYLSQAKFVHRDLAARNCMMSSDGVIKVADFGLTEDVYTKNYFRLHMIDDSSKTQVKLPIKWMALESIHDGLYSEKTDVWSYGILCWEVFNLGRTPYPGMTPREVVEFLDSGERLDKPKNIACSDQIHAFIKSCWNQNPDDRRSFSDIISLLNKLIQPLANYMDFASFYSQKKLTDKAKNLP